MFSAGGGWIEVWWPMMSYGLAGLGAVLCLGVIARTIFLPIDVRRACCCGACRHPIVEPVPNRCPECGGQLTKVGISTPAMAVRLRGGLGWALLAWTIVCGAAVSIVGGVVIQQAWAAAMAASGGWGGATTAQTAMQYSLVSRDSSVSRFPGSEAAAEKEEQELRLAVSLNPGSSGSNPGQAVLILRQSGTADEAVLTLSLAERTFELKDKAGKSVKKGADSEINDELTKTWFESVGLKDSRDMRKNRADARKIARFCFDDPEGIQPAFSTWTSMSGGLTIQSSGPAGTLSGMPVFTPPTPVYWTPRNKLIGGVLAAVYLAGCVAIWWRRRRLLA